MVQGSAAYCAARRLIIPQTHFPEVREREKFEKSKGDEDRQWICLKCAAPDADEERLVALKGSRDRTD
jgi:nitrate reductase cytochrome c-type subunit